MRKYKLLIIVFILLLTLSSCSIPDSEQELFYQSTSNDTDLEGIAQPASIETDVESYNDMIVVMNILGNATLYVDQSRFSSSEGHPLMRNLVYNQWSSDELDQIFNAIQGIWTIDSYVGFVSFRLYLPELFRDDFEVAGGEKRRDFLLEMYELRRRKAQENIPNLQFSVDAEQRILLINDTEDSPGNPSPVTIILSVSDDHMPNRINQTTSADVILGELPVLYIQFFIQTGGFDSEAVQHDNSYKIATLVITSDEGFFVLMDGAFYSLRHCTECVVNYGDREVED